MSEMSQTIIDAAARLLKDEGASALTTRRVAELAGTQVPTIYRFFGDKDGLLAAVARQVMADYVSAKAADSAIEGASANERDPIADLRAAFRTHVEFGLSNPALFGLLISPGRGSVADGQEVLRARVRRVAATGSLRVSEERAVQMISAAGNGALLIMLDTPEADRDDDLGEAMLDAVMRAILTDDGLTSPAPGAARRPIGAAVALGAELDDLPALTPAERSVLKEWLDRAIAELQSETIARPASPGAPSVAP